MTSFHGTGTSSQTNQHRGATSKTTSQSGPTQVPHNPTSTPSNIHRSATLPSHLQGVSRPQSIAELAERAKQCLGYVNRPIKTWLQIAEDARQDAKNFHEQGDLDSAFVKYALGATIVFEKLPAHPDYMVLLTERQRRNVRLHGQEILEGLADVKYPIMKRYENWRENSTLLELQAPASSMSVADGSITTTSPLPPQLGTQYISLMTRHQMSQGYHPSLSSMFHRLSNTCYSALLFQTPESAPSSGTRPPPLLKDLIAPPPDGLDPVSHELKTISFPRDCLKRFITIASINTARNRETCGLLLGKAKGARYVVTTLLIPKQHATTDTCTIDDDELVMQFTEERFLITLGWIHTHPMQSCFMSSRDLHAQSEYQRKLPESFAVVCAPNSTPNIGIFRLTDPSGLQMILECQASEAFHSHPERPIYTDADKGHVEIYDLPLEVVDLRGHMALEGSMTSNSGLRVLAPPSEDPFETFKRSSSGYRHSGAAGDGEGGEEEADDDARTVMGHDKPISEHTPKQRPAVLPWSRSPVQRSYGLPKSKPLSVDISAGPGSIASSSQRYDLAPRWRHADLPPFKSPVQRSLVSSEFRDLSVDVSTGSGLFTGPIAGPSVQPDVNERNRNARAVANFTVEASQGFDVFNRASEPEQHSHQADYLRILQDKFGTPRPNRGDRYSFTDDTSMGNGGNCLESFVDPDNESYNGRHSLKSVSKRSFQTSSIVSPAPSQVTSIFG